MLRVKQYSNMKESRPNTSKTSKGRETNERRNNIDTNVPSNRWINSIRVRRLQLDKIKNVHPKKTYIVTYIYIYMLAVLIFCMAQFDKTR